EIRAKLLIVDDDDDLRTQMKWALAKEYHVLEATDGFETLAVFAEEKPPVITLDLGLPPDPDGVSEGFKSLKTILELEPHTKVIIITGQDQKENAMKAISQGAYDFLAKPVLIEDLKVIVNRALYLSHLEAEYRSLQMKVIDEPFHDMLGASPQILSMQENIRKVAPSDVPIMIYGESGTGKELAAQAIHRISSRSDKPFIVINCSAIPVNLLESELFGHEKGSFTGAHMRRKGRFELANGGTLFLDEVGELPPPLQVKLLRFLQEHVIERVGGRELIEVDARIVAATNQDLEESIKEGLFREDLYYRLGVVTISLPPLRKREGDIPLLSKAMLNRYAAENNKKVKAFTPAAMRSMKNYGWPGNIREMENRVKRA
ncbi:MAG: PEP-CTERM-box response regulator transcription factor, partial [bacterium]